MGTGAIDSKVALEIAQAKKKFELEFATFKAAIQAKAY